MLGRHLPQPWVLVRIPPLGGEDIDDLDELVDRAVHANPLVGDLDLGLVDEPVIDRGVQARPRGVDRQEGTSLYPAEHGGRRRGRARPAVPLRLGRTGRTSGGSSDTGLTKVIDDQVKFDGETAHGLLQYLADIPELSPEP